jgi:hypothetical protein
VWCTVHNSCDFCRPERSPWPTLCSSPLRFTKSDYRPLPFGDLSDTNNPMSTNNVKSKIPGLDTTAFNWSPDVFGTPKPCQFDFPEVQPATANEPHNSIPINFRRTATPTLPEPTATTAQMEGQFAIDENLEWLEQYLAQNQTQQTGNIMAMLPPIDFYREQQQPTDANEAMWFDIPQEQPEPTALDLDELWRQIFGEAQQTPDTWFPPTQPDTPIFEEPLLPTPPSEPSTQASPARDPPGWGFSAIQFVDCARGSSQQPGHPAPRPPPPPVDESPTSPLKKGNKYGRGGRLRCQKCRNQHTECIFDPSDLSKPCRTCVKSRTKDPCFKTFGPKKEERRKRGGPS